MRSGETTQEPPPERRFVPPELLYYGHDKVLLLARQQMLGRLGCAAQIVFNATDYWKFLVERSPSVIVFCQTLTPSECQDAMALAERYRPNAYFLVMFTRRPPVAEGPGCMVLEAQEGSLAFAHAVFNLL